MKKILITSGIALIAAMAISDTISHFKETDDVAIVTPAQENMRTPSNQNPGQIQRDMQTQKLRNNQSDPAWNKNPNNNSNRFDNYNRNRDRDNMRQYMNREESMDDKDIYSDKPNEKSIWNNDKKY